MAGWHKFSKTKEGTTAATAFQWEQFAYSIIDRAVVDYVNALRGIPLRGVNFNLNHRKTESKEEASARICVGIRNECEDFFENGWLFNLLEIDSEVVMALCQKSARQSKKAEKMHITVEGIIEDELRQSA